MSHQIEVVAALLSQDGRVLVQRRPPGKARAELWEFPGGKPEVGERGETALRRECREELGIEVQVGAEVWSTVHRYEDVEIHLIFYRCALLAGELMAREGQQLRWATPLELLALPFVAADRPLLELLNRGEISL